MEDLLSKNNEDNNKNVQTTSVKCASCGANMVFDPVSQTLNCSHCGTKQSFKKDLFANEIDIISGIVSNEKWSQKDVTAYFCDNCGAKSVFSKGQTSTECPFCGTSHVTKIEEIEGVKPNGVLPFSFGEDKGVEFAKIWAKKRFFAPRKFKKNLTTKNVKGVYTPCFTFDSFTISFYTAKLGTTRYRTIGSGKDRRTESYTEWRIVRGSFSWRFDDVLITAGEKLDQKNLDKINPFDTNKSNAYDENFLLGFSAYHYDRDINDCWNDAVKIMDNQLKSLILGQYSYDKLGCINVATNHNEVTYKYVLLPVYVGNFSYNKKLYNFYVNGTNGKVYGKAPVSFLKIVFTVLTSIALIGLIGLLIYSS